MSSTNRLDMVGVSTGQQIALIRSVYSERPTMERSVPRPPDLGVDFDHVVQQPVIVGDADPAGVEASQRVARPGRHLAGRCRLEHLRSRVELEEEPHCLGDVGVRAVGRGDVGAVDLGGRVDDGVQRDDVTEAVLGLLGGADRAVRRRDVHPDTLRWNVANASFNPTSDWPTTASLDRFSSDSFCVKCWIAARDRDRGRATRRHRPYDLRPIVTPEEDVLVECVDQHLTQRLSRRPMR